MSSSCRLDNCTAHMSCERLPRLLVPHVCRCAVPYPYLPAATPCLMPSPRWSCSKASSASCSWRACCTPAAGTSRSYQVESVQDSSSVRAVAVTRHYCCLDVPLHGSHPHSSVALGLTSTKNACTSTKAVPVKMMLLFAIVLWAHAMQVMVQEWARAAKSPASCSTATPGAAGVWSEVFMSWQAYFVLGHDKHTVAAAGACSICCLDSGLLLHADALCAF